VPSVRSAKLGRRWLASPAAAKKEYIMKVYINFSNFRDTLVDGATLVYGSRNGKIQRDETWNGGFKIDGRSIKNILEQYVGVYMIS
jgi:hypothetical protein